MIISQISEGLGNQLFQYAAGRRLARHHDTLLRIDDYHYRLHPFRSFGLHHFQIQAAMASADDIRKLCPKEWLERKIRAWLPGRLPGATLRTLRAMGLGSPYHSRLLTHAPGTPTPPLVIGNVASERHFHFDPDLLSCPDNVCLAGYWQDERYFSDISPLIRAELQLRRPAEGENLKALARIQDHASVSLHVRRGDKASASCYHATSLEYCQAAMALAKAYIMSPTFFVFSDDWAWVHHHLPADSNIVHVDHNGPDDVHEDFRLMGACQHHIIASSSLSWWAAWVNDTGKKLIVSPPANKWLNFDNHLTSEVLPGHWRQLGHSLA